MFISSTWHRLLLNIYPPYFGSGIVIKSIDPDYHKLVVQLKMHWYNRNYMHTYFGGSLYAMTDPFYMLMLIQILGKDYIVWDKSAQIEFIKPGLGTLSAEFILGAKQIQDIKKNTSLGEKYLPEYLVEIKDETGDTVARVRKVLYIRRKEKK